MEAFKRVNEAKTDIAEVLMPYDLWPILESALVNDLGPLQVGEICDRQAGLMRGRDKRIEVGFNVMESILKAITDRA